VLGYLVVDKPPGLTSHDIVGIVRAVTGIKKVGHTGTLDPFATGVLPLALGKATKFIQYLDEGLKVYDATIDFSRSTDTGDLDGDLLDEGGPPDWSLLPEVFAQLTGPQMQTPPAYSAVKVDGKPLYKYARAGVEKKAKARPITIYGLEELGRTEGTLEVRIRCSRGTYARVLAQDIARGLGTHGHLCALRRAASGPFVLDGALTFPQLADIVTGNPDWLRAFRGRKHTPPEDRVPWLPRPEVVSALSPRVIPLRKALEHLPSVPGDPKILQGAKGPPPPPGLDVGARYAVHDGPRLLAVAESCGAFGKVLLRG
jgi:tRNA pseudouridine55 synthase